MNLDAIIVVLTGSIGIAATWMAIGLLRRQPDRVDGLSAIGFRSPWWPTVFGLVLLVSVAGLIIGWWQAPIGIIAIVAIKVLYSIVLVAYRRADRSRDRDQVTVLMTTHSLAALLSIGLLVAS